MKAYGTMEAHGAVFDVDGKLLERPTPRPISEYHEDFGPVLWWWWIEGKNGLPARWAGEPPYVGTPSDLPLGTVECQTIISMKRGIFGREWKEVGGWPGYHTHFTPLPPMPKEPTP